MGAGYAKSSLMNFASFVPVKSENNLEVVMRSLIKLCLLMFLPATLSANAPSPPSTNAPVAAIEADLLLREIRYDGKLTDNEAKFLVDIDAESMGKIESSVALFEGDVAVMPAKLPSGLRMVRKGNQYRLVASKPGKYKFKLELVARITRAEPWNQISFTGPDAGIA